MIGNSDSENPIEAILYLIRNIAFYECAHSKGEIVQLKTIKNMGKRSLILIKNFKDLRLGVRKDNNDI